MNAFVPNGYLTLSAAIDRVVEIVAPDSVLTAEESGKLQSVRDWRLELSRKKPTPVTPVPKVTDRTFVRRAPADQTTDVAVKANPRPNISPDEIKALMAKETRMKEQELLVSETLRQLMYDGRVSLEIITDGGALLRVPKHILGGEEWNNALRFDRVKFVLPGSHPLAKPIEGRPLISQSALEAAFDPDGAVRADPEPTEHIAPEQEQVEGPGPGRKPGYNWDEFMHEVVRRAHIDGLPDTLAEAEKMMAEWCINHWGERPVDSTIRKKLSPLYGYLRSQGAIKS